MIVDDIVELMAFGVVDRGVPNKERILFRASETVNLGCYGIMVGVTTGDGTAVPVRDNMLWFGDGILRSGEWLCVFTCPGSPIVSKIPNSEDRMISVFWGRKSVVFKEDFLVPILFRIDGVVVEKTVLPPLSDSKPPNETLKG